MKKTRILSIVLALCMILCLVACGTPPKTSEPAAETAAAVPAEPKILKLAASFAYPSLDAHKEYYGWYTSK